MDRHDATVAKVTEVDLFAQFAFGEKLLAPCAKKPGIAIRIGDLDLSAFRLGFDCHFGGAFKADVFVFPDRQEGVLGRRVAVFADSFFHLDLLVGALPPPLFR